MEDNNMARELLNEQNLEDIVGGAYNFYYDENGVKCCQVDGVGTYQCTADAQDKLIFYKLQYKGQGLTAQDYVNLMINAGCFF